MSTRPEHPVRDVDAAVRAILDRVRADADGAGLVLDVRVDPGFASPGAVDDAPQVDRVVAVIGGHVFSVGLAHGLEAGCATVMSGYQDDAVDSLGRPWPELVDGDGEGLGVLDVAVEPLGLAHWALRGRPLCAVGQLRASCDAQGWRIR